MMVGFGEAPLLFVVGTSDHCYHWLLVPISGPCDVAMDLFLANYVSLR